MIATFPHMGNYYIAFEALIKRLYKDVTVIIPPPITVKTLELGSRYSPDYVCVPFKYTLGSLIEMLEKGVGITHLFQAGCYGGCRVDFYGELQAKILRELGYEFEIISPFRDPKFNPVNIYRTLKRAGKTVNIFAVLNLALVAIEMIKSIDKIDAYISANIGFEVVPNSFDKVHKEYVAEIVTAKTMFGIKRIHNKYLKKLKKLEINKPEKPFRVVITGEIFCAVDPSSNYFVERQLAKFGIEVHRMPSLTYSMIGGGYKYRQRELRKVKKKGYLTYDTGSDGSVGFALEAAEKGFDGILHLKPFGCIVEVNAMPTMINIGRDYGVPIMFFSFDSQTNSTSLKTRLEAFYDMLCMKKQ